MKLLNLYSWIAGTRNNFIKQFQDNDQLFNKAKDFWDKLDGLTLIVVIAMFSIAIGMAAYYYTYYNNRPGRHYKPMKWLIFLGMTFIVTLLVSLCLEYILCKPELTGSMTLEIMVALGNSIYAIVVYLITSLVWCRYLPTNAYRLLKFK